MGFRDLSLFNQAMLGRQAWRLLTRPESLCAKVLKGKYFPHKTFWKRQEKKKSSETWRAILFSREALVKGLIRRVGPGDSINIWKDNWIAGSSSFKPLVRLPKENVDKVCELFIPGTRCRDEQQVRGSFCALDATEILKIKPGARLQKDLLTWAFERNGMYSIRSCYRLLKQEAGKKEAFRFNGARSSEEQIWWKKVWKLDVPPKICIFWWRVMQDYLPTKAELMRRHVAREDHCETCGERSESLYHVVFKGYLCGSVLECSQGIDRVQTTPSVPSLVGEGSPIRGVLQH
jgi:hypothetical protein